MKEIVIVTAFFSLGGNKGRTDEKSLSYFKLWAKLKNRIICYVESQTMKEKIEEFRDSIGLLQMTEIIIIDNAFSIDPQLYESIKRATDNQVLQTYYMHPGTPSHFNPNYNYIMLLKSWCCKDAASKEINKNSTIVWMDFGFNHGNNLLDSSSDFNYHWTYNFPDDKITIFSLRPFDNRPLFDIVFCGAAYVSGSPIAASARLWEKLWKMMRSNMIHLNTCGLCDSDETILIMCYRECPDLFNVIQTHWWGEGFWLCGGQHLSLVKPERRIEEKDKWFFKAAYKTLVENYVRRIEDYLNNQFYML